MSGSGILAADRGGVRPGASAIAGAIVAAKAAGADEQRARDADYVDALAARIEAGPRPRESWELPVNTQDYEAAEKGLLCPILRALATSIRAGIYAADGGEHAGA